MGLKVTVKPVKEGTTGIILDDETVATVSDGTITAVAAGTVTITAKVGSYTAICMLCLLATIFVRMLSGTLKARKCIANAWRTLTAVWRRFAIRSLKCLPGHKKVLAENKEMKKNPPIGQKRFADHTSTIERDSK